MPNQTNVWLAALTALSLTVTAVVGKQLSDTRAELTRTQTELAAAKNRLHQAVQAQARLQGQLDTLRRQHADRLAALDKALRQSPNWANQALPENLKQELNRD